MNRAGFSLIEMTVTIAIMVVVLDIGITATGRLARAASAEGQPAKVVDLACDALRRDLAHGARIEGRELVAGEARWRLDAGILLRDGAPRCRVSEASWTIDGQAVVVRLRPLGLPIREVRAWR